jgi:hypothetical protein
MPHTPVDEIQRARAKQLRRAMTRAETLLWRHLKANRLAGVGFRRQSPMGNYVADASSSWRSMVKVTISKNVSATMIAAIDGLSLAGTASSASPMMM